MLCHDFILCSIKYYNEIKIFIIYSKGFIFVVKTIKVSYVSYQYNLLKQNISRYIGRYFIFVNVKKI